MVKAKYSSGEIRQTAKELVKLLAANEIAVDKIILYGSYAAGSPRKHSDIDIAVISPSFKGKKMLEIQEQLARVFSKYLSIIEPVGYSSEDFRTAEPETMAGEIRRSGKILYAA